MAQSAKSFDGNIGKNELKTIEENASELKKTGKQMVSKMKNLDINNIAINIINDFTEDISWFWLWLASFASRFSLATSLIFYIIYLILFVISVNVKLYKQSCISLIDWFNLPNIYNIIYLGCCNIIIVFSLGIYFNMSKLKSLQNLIILIIYIIIKQVVIFSLNKFSIDRYVSIKCNNNLFCSINDIEDIKAIDNEGFSNVNSRSILYNSNEDNNKIGNILNLIRYNIDGTSNFIFSRLYKDEEKILLYIIGIYLVDTFISANYATKVINNNKLYTYYKDMLSRIGIWHGTLDDIYYISTNKKIDILIFAINKIKILFLFWIYSINILNIYNWYINKINNINNNKKKLNLSFSDKVLYVFFPVLVLLQSYIPYPNLKIPYSGFDINRIRTKFNNNTGITFLLLGPFAFKRLHPLTQILFFIIYCKIWLFCLLIILKKNNLNIISIFNILYNKLKLKDQTAKEILYVIAIILFIIISFSIICISIICLIKFENYISKLIGDSYDELNLIIFRISIILVPIVFIFLYILNRQYIISKYCFNKSMCIGKIHTNDTNDNIKEIDNDFHNKNKSNKKILQIIFLIVCLLYFIQLFNLIFRFTGAEKLKYLLYIIFCYSIIIILYLFKYESLSKAMPYSYIIDIIIIIFLIIKIGLYNIINKKNG